MPTLNKTAPTKAASSGQTGLRRAIWAVVVIGLLTCGLWLSGLFKPSAKTPSAGNSKTSSKPAGQNSTAVLGKAAPSGETNIGVAPTVPTSVPATSSTSKPQVGKSDEASVLKQHELEQKQAELDAKAAQQAALEAQQLEKQRQLAEAQQQLEARQHQVEVAAAAADSIKHTEAPPKPIYRGPSSGDLVWEGPVKGSTLVTITGNTCDSGTLVSGALPGVPVIIQPKDAKHTRLASTPAPSNSYQRLVFGISGNGNMQVVLHWTQP